MKTSQGSLVGPVESDEQIDSFLSSHEPSYKQVDNGRGGWYWVYSGHERTVEQPSEENTGEFEKQGFKLKQAREEECARIKIEEPVRENKKLGKKSQKQCRDIAYTEFNQAVEKLSKKYGVLSGKWLLYPGEEKVDRDWKKLVYAMASKDGALAKHPKCNIAKVAGAPETGSEQFAICVYVDDSWDRKAVEEVFMILVKELSLVPISYKCDANTLLDISSKHVSGIRASRYTAADFMSKEAIKTFFEEKRAEEEAKDPKSKPKLKETTLVEQAAEEGGFDPVSDSDEDEPKKPAKKKQKT